VRARRARHAAARGLLPPARERHLARHRRDLCGLGWTCALEKDFTGVDELRRIEEDGPERKLVAFEMQEKAIPRHGMAIDGGGIVTSGSHSPMLDVGIGMGYVSAESGRAGTDLTIDVRGRARAARIVKKPIYKREES
jgi:aminomethyltransferase